MSDAAQAATSPTNYGARRESLRDTAKWVMGTVGALLAAVLAAAPFTRLAALDFDDRGKIAAAGLVTAAIGCGWLMSRAIAVLATNVRSWDQILGDTDKLAVAARAKTQAMLVHSLPPSIPTLDALGTRYTAASKLRQENKASPNFTALRGYVDVAADLFLLVEMREKFDRLMGYLYWMLPVVILGMLAFVWGAGAPAEPAPLGRPYPISVAWKAQNDAVLKASGLREACYKPGLGLVGVGQEPGGRVLAVSAPSPGCPPQPFVLVGPDQLVAASW